MKTFPHRAEYGNALSRLAVMPLAIVLICGLGGCIGSGPELSAGKGVQSGGEVIIPIAAANKTQTPIPLRKLEYTVSIDGGAPITVTRSALATVHSLTVQTLELPVPAAPGARTYAITGELVYVPARKFWKVMYDEEIYRPGVSFSFQGEIDQASAAPAHSAAPAPDASKDNRASAKGEEKSSTSGTDAQPVAAPAK